jgi:hypothetical protein
MATGPGETDDTPEAEPRTESPHAALEASPNAIVAVRSDGRLSYANPQAVATFGYPHDELIGLPVETLLPDRLERRHVGHRTGFFARPTARPMGIGLDLAGRRRDGSEFPVEISLSPVDTAGELVVYATVVDITARKATEAALAASERRFRAVLEASPNAVVAVDADGRIMYANPQVEETFGYTREALLGEQIGTLLPDRVRDRHKDHRARYMSQPTARPMGIGLELAGRRRDGREFPVEISLSPVDTPDGRVVFATVVDITARKAAEDQLLQARKMESVGRLAGGIAHDFNNMLLAIRGYAELLRDDLSVRGTVDLDSARQSVEAIHDAADRAASLTAQLLAFSRQQVVTTRILDPRATILGLEPMLRRLIGEQVNLVMRLDGLTGHVRADPGQLDQIIVNLVVNARDALPSGGTVTIESGNAAFSEPYAAEHFEVLPGRYVMLAVSDTGVGIERSVREHIFEPFFTTKERGKGTGLGLATIYGIVKQAGGHIWLYSEPGLGTTFKLYFPIVEGAVDAEPAAPLAAPRTGTGTILVAEDEAVVRDFTTRVLERAGYRVVAADSGDAALEILDRVDEPFLAVVTDVVMPGMSGTALAELVLERFPAVGVVLLSGYTAEVLDLTRALGRGATFVGKPFTPAELIEAIQAAVASTVDAG